MIEQSSGILKILSSVHSIVQFRLLNKVLPIKSTGWYHRKPRYFFSVMDSKVVVRELRQLKRHGYLTPTITCMGCGMITVMRMSKGGNI